MPNDEGSVGVSRKLYTSSAMLSNLFVPIAGFESGHVDPNAYEVPLATVIEIVLLLAHYI